MIGTPQTGTLANAILSGVAHEGLTATTTDGQPATLAVVDSHGNIIESGPQVAREAWNVAIAVYRNFLIGHGHLRVQTSPSYGGVQTGQKNAA